ncbi:MAG: M23 family metallopeptidase, partial [Alphaproteobacteria bacterium]|nr:M23 family metallopeptidase [Alphaproteobacteria bacterium]
GTGAAVNGFAPPSEAWCLVGFAYGDKGLFGKGHPGIDLKATNGTQIKSIGNGVVDWVYDGCSCNNCSCGDGNGFGNWVRVDHGIVVKQDGSRVRVRSTYHHLQRGSIVVYIGQQVAVGQPLATIGRTGYSTADHLHFGMTETAESDSLDSCPFEYGTKDNGDKCSVDPSDYLGPVADCN